LNRLLVTPHRHFRQAILTDMKGAGEPVSEHDFPLGSDIVGDILRGPRSTERMSLSCLVVLLLKLKWFL
jgi:hypothetical protein